MRCNLRLFFFHRAESRTVCVLLGKLRNHILYIHFGGVTEEHFLICLFQVFIRNQLHLIGILTQNRLCLFLRFFYGLLCCFCLSCLLYKGFLCYCFLNPCYRFFCGYCLFHLRFNRLHIRYPDHFVIRSRICLCGFIRTLCMLYGRIHLCHHQIIHFTCRHVSGFILQKLPHTLSELLL